MTCEKCGRVHSPTVGSRPCLGHISGISHPERKGEPCTRQALVGMDVCHAHGPNKAARAKARERIEREKAEKTMAKYVTRVDDADPGEVLLDLICEGFGTVKFYRAQRDALDLDEFTWGRTKEVDGDVVVGNGPLASLQNAVSTTSEAKPNIWVVLLREAEKDLAGYCVDALKVGLKQREIDIAERAADQALPVLKAFVAAMGLELSDPAVVTAFKSSFRHLRAVPDTA